MVFPFMSNLPPNVATLTDYLIDKYEVTNKQFKGFVAAGGYQNQEFWRHSFVKDGRAISWEEAMAEFRDGDRSTGDLQPGRWEIIQPTRAIIPLRV